MWCGHLDDVIATLEALPYPLVDRATVERVLGVGRRRAQQILAPCVSEQIGANGVAHRDVLVAHLRRLAAGRKPAGETVRYERLRRVRFAQTIEELRRTRVEQPATLVEAPLDVVNQDLINLPPGISLTPGKVTIEFHTAVEALEKLLALAMAAGNDLERFEGLVERIKTHRRSMMV